MNSDMTAEKREILKLLDSADATWTLIYRALRTAQKRTTLAHNINSLEAGGMIAVIGHIQGEPLYSITDSGREWLGANNG